MTATAQIAEQMQLSEPGQALAAAHEAPLAAVSALIGAQRYGDALPLSLRLLPTPYALAWTCQCAGAQPLDERDAHGLRLAQRWMRERDEPSRQAAQAFAENDDYRSPGAWLAAAAAWASGAPAAEGGAPPAAHLTAVAANAALVLLASREPERFDERLQRWAEQAHALLGQVHPTEQIA
ncbi:DUF6931 family protein [Lysobacter enzymogenes]|uniref:DUF6931 family protein n=1 Tax=Lysobacter enzymogenes TaxID=69 RepID=UPI00099BE7D6|nr:hypothetical protein [Lysobacter enzymogenes]QQQ03707.1 hypothetical protein JHW41_12540 [Lysobacter enzymogenes]UZW58411.1 hypothetical protein BV903_013885 [Lysobacter enzymogenes]